MLKPSRSTLFRAFGAAALVAAAVLPLTVPSTAHAWWVARGWPVGVYVGVPAPVVVAPPPVYAPPPVAYVAPPVVYARPVWYPAHWYRGYWVRGHWG